MIITCAYPAPAQRRERRETSTFHGWRTDYILGPAGPRKLMPQAFLVEQDPRFELSSHYHLQHQFQVIVAGKGALGKHEVTPFTTHYASRESGYGPIVASDEGLWYFSLRVIPDTTTWVLPEHRDSMTAGLRKRQRYSDAPRAPLERPGATGVDALMPLDEHGCGAWFVRLAPRDSLVLPDAASGAGRYHIVASGSMTIGGESLGPLSISFASSDETEFGLKAGQDGLQVMVVQFPADALS
jgi:hypothetical protein